MGAVRDWREILKSVDYLDFYCVLTFMPVEENVKNNLFGQTDEKIAMQIGRKELYEEENSRRLSLRNEEENVLNEIVRREEVWQNLITQMSSAEETVRNITVGENEKAETERYVFKRDERADYGYEVKNNGDALERVRVREIMESTAENPTDKTRLNIETKRTRSLEAGEDIDKITDMLTLRLCEMMQKSADGFYV